MLIDPCRNAAILERSLRTKAVEDDSIAVGALDELSDHLAAVGEFIYLDVDGALHWYQVFACIVEVIPRWAIIHASDQSGVLAGESKLSTVVRMFSGLKNPGPFVFFWSAKLPRNSSRHEQQRDEQCC